MHDAYMMRRALPGRFEVGGRSPVALTVHVTLSRNWGRANQTSEELTIQFDGSGEAVTIAEDEFGFPE